MLLTNGGALAAAARALDDGVAAALASGFHHSHADHGEGFCTFNGLVVAAEALRAAGRVRTRRGARPRPALRQRHRVAVRRRGPGSSTARSTATTTGRTRPYRDVEHRRHSDGPNHVSFALAERQRPRRAARGARARHRGTARLRPPGSRALSGRRRPVPRGSRTRRSISTTTICASATAASSRGRSARGCRSPGCSRAATRPTSRRSSTSTSARSTRQLSVYRGAAMLRVRGDEASSRRLLAGWTGLVLLFFYLPIAILVLFSFNESRLNIVWTGFTLEWYAALWRDARAGARAEEQPDRRGVHDGDLGRARHRRRLAAATATATAASGAARDARVPADDRARGDPRREPADPVRHDRPPARLHDDRDLARHVLLPVRDGRGAGAPRGPRSRRSRRRRSISARRRCRPSRRCWCRT